MSEGQSYKPHGFRQQLLIFRQGSLLLRKFHQLLLYCQTLPAPHCVHVLPGTVLRVSLLSVMQVLLFGSRGPKRIDVDHLKNLGSGELRLHRSNKPGLGDMTLKLLPDSA